MLKCSMRLGVFCLVMVVGISACGPFGGTAPATQAPAAASTSAPAATTAGGESSAQPTATAVATNTPTTAAGTGATGAATSAPSGTASGVGAIGSSRSVGTVSGGLDKLASYHAHAVYKFDGTDKTGKPTTGQMDYSSQVVNSTHDEHVHLVFTGQPLGVSTPNTSTPQELETYNVGGNSFLITAGKCQFLSSGTTASTRALFTPDTFVGVDKATLVGLGENVNGVVANHYIFTEAALGASNSLNGMKLQKGDVWISLTGYIVRINAQLTGTAKSGESGTVNFTYDVDQVGQVPAIVAPADCVAVQAAADIPVPPNATEKKVLAAGGQSIITFKTSDDPKTVADFYRQAMPGQGWTAGKDTASGGISIQLEFTKNGGKRTVMVVMIAAAGTTNVIITDKTAS